MLDSLQDLTWAIISIFFVLSLSSIVVRTYTRGYIVKNFGWDDWCMIVIIFFNGGQLAILCYMLLHGAGLHLITVYAHHLPWLQDLVYAIFVEEIYYTLMHWIIKMAFLLFYLRLFNTKTFRRMVYGTMALNTLVAISTWALYCLQCMPLDAYFHPAAHPTVKCLDRRVQAFLPASLNIFIDILIFVLPIRPLWQIQVSLRKRLMLISIVSPGFIVVLISCLRMIVLQEFQQGKDITYTLGKLIIISVIEIDVAIIAANGPSIKTFWSRHVSRTITTDNAYDTNKMSDFSKRRTMRSQATRCGALGDAPVPSQDGHSQVELKRKESGIVVSRSIAVETSSIESGEHDSHGRYHHFDSAV